ncbi:sulfatase family protein [Sphingobacterium spiritivorum]|uniref:sulfatase family protein n=1 Tax=Sphingobacterium spiritivorum TaxID=258 RepID=UPI003DA2F853
MNSIRYLITLFICLLAVFNSSAQNQPNFIIIYVDDMGYGDVGINGNPNIETPNLDRMAMEGMRFSNYYSASPACTASRFALLTGKYPSRAGFRWVLNPTDQIGIHQQESTIAERLKEKGYRTAIYGKWHLGSTRKEFLPLANGFDEYVGLPYSNDMIPPKYPDIALLSGYDTLELNPDQSKLTRLYTEKAIAFITKNAKQPFFIYLPYAMPHTPLHASEDFLGKSKRGLYGDVVQELDHHIGRLLTFLKENKLDQQTYVVFTSDNGPWLIQNQNGGSAGLFRDGKGSTWEGGMREPFFLWGHHTIPKGYVENEVFTALDMLPTITALAGISAGPNKIDGTNLKPLWSGKKDTKGRDEFFYFGLDHQLMAVRKGPWKLHVKTYSQLGLVYFDKQLPLLFNLDHDPSEKYNLASQYPEMVSDLTTLILSKEKEIAEEGSFWKNTP